jgi:hypothetical protein
MSISDVLTVIGVVAGVAGMVFDLNWVVRTAFVALALLLTVYAGRTADNFHPVIRLAISIVIRLASSVGLSASNPIYWEIVLGRSGMG